MQRAASDSVSDLGMQRAACFLFDLLDAIVLAGIVYDSNGTICVQVCGSHPANNLMVFYCTATQLAESGPEPSFWLNAVV